MKLFRKRSDKKSSSLGKAPAVRSPGENEAPKNGRLFLAVVGCFVVMIALGALNIRLFGSPSVAGRIFGKTRVVRADGNDAYRPPVISTGTGEKVCYVPPEVTFYRKLTSQDEVAIRPGGARSPVDSSRAGSFPKAAASAGDPAIGDAQEKRFPKPAATCDPGRMERQRRPAELPRAENGKKRYTVQVGAFTQPGIARQWATRWKAKGYHVSLKPVARPVTGVIHRLYLGDFSSARKADELVKRLKTKEGIEAFRLVLRN